MDRDETNRHRSSSEPQSARTARWEAAEKRADRSQKKYPENSRREADGPGMANEPQEGRPTTTGSPGGGLGLPDEAELKRDPEETSEKQDTRVDEG